MSSHGEEDMMICMSGYLSLFGSLTCVWATSMPDKRGLNGL
jgi:hypothetical protein